MSDESRQGPHPFVSFEERERQRKELEEWLQSQPEDVQKQWRESWLAQQAERDAHADRLAHSKKESI